MTPGNVLVTGGAGFIGSALTRGYLEAGWEVVVVDDLSTGRREQVPTEARFHRVDIRDPQVEDLFRREHFTLINHHAAQINVRTSVQDPAADARVNILGTLHLLHLAHRFNVPGMVLISSGGAIYGEPESLPVPETAPKRPLSPYAISKCTTEHYAYFYQQVHGLHYVCLRYGNVYGPGQNPDTEAGVIAIFSEQMLRAEQPSVFGDGTQLRDYVFVEDVVRANLQATERLHRLNQHTNTPDDLAYNIGTARGTSVNTLYDRLADLTNYPHPAQHAAPRPGEINRIILDVSRARDRLAWQPTISLDEGLRRTVAHFAAG